MTEYTNPNLKGLTRATADGFYAESADGNRAVLFMELDTRDTWNQYKHPGEAYEITTHDLDANKTAKLYAQNITEAKRAAAAFLQH